MAGRRHLWFAPCLVLLAIPGGRGAPARELANEPPGTLESGLIERAEIALVSLDVEVEDGEGEPVHGLTRDDFLVRLNGRRWPVYSVDELCPRAADSAGAASLESMSAPPGGADGVPGSTPDPPPAYEPLRFVLYFDSSQLQVDGRINAIRAAERWIRKTMRPADQAMVVVFASLSGLRELSPFTSDKEQLLEAVARVLADPEFLDSFPTLFRARIANCLRCVADCKAERVCPDCVDCCGSVCLTNARDELLHGRRALQALSVLLVRLEQSPGRKALVLFHQNGVLYPSRFYPGRDVGDQLSLLDGVAADAALARTSIYPAFAGPLARTEGPLADQAVSFGANLADYTGGDYNRGGFDLTSLLNRAARGPACVYRVAIRPPPDYKDRIFRAEVRARDYDVRHQRRLRVLDDADRWWRSARAVLAAPETASDIAVSAALVPLGISEDGWDLLVEVGVETASLLELPSVAGRRADWEIGALLTRDDGDENWEMLARSRAMADDPAPATPPAVVHERLFPSLKPGRYRLAAFARDRAANVFGGAEATLELPEQGREGIIGPLLMRMDSTFVKSVLPLLREESGAVRSSRVHAGLVPVGNAPVERGARLAVLTWVCPGQDSPRPPSVLRFVASGGAPLFRFETEPRPSGGACYSLDDRIETLALQTGPHTYRVRWSAAADAEPLEEQVSWNVGEARNAPR